MRNIDNILPPLNQEELAYLLSFLREVDDNTLLTVYGSSDMEEIVKSNDGNMRNIYDKMMEHIRRERRKTYDQYNI